MGKIKAIRILNGTESYSAIVGKKYMCPDGEERNVERIEVSTTGGRYIIHLEDRVRIFVEAINALAQFE